MRGFSLFSLVIWLSLSFASANVLLSELALSQLLGLGAREKARDALPSFYKVPLALHDEFWWSDSEAENTVLATAIDARAGRNLEKDLRQKLINGRRNGRDFQARWRFKVSEARSW